MDSKLKVTDVPEEASFYDLVSGDNVLGIPLFQRPYMWKESHLKAFWQDIANVDDEASAAVFLGVIVSFGMGAGPGRPPTWMIVDGQQRVTTLYLSVMAAVDVAAKAGDLDYASDILGRFLLVRPMSGISVNTKLIPSFSDRAQFSSIWKQISEIKNFASHSIFASNPPKPPVSSGEPTGAMTKQYNRIRSELTKLHRGNGLEALEDRINVITMKMSVVSISLRDPTVAPKIFERLNYGAEPVTVADLVRNEVFARSGDDPQTALHLFESRWEPFVSRFEDKNSDLNRFLFPYGLIHNSNVKKADLFVALRKHWEKFEDPKQIIDDLEQYQPAYLALMSGAKYLPQNPEIEKRVSRLQRSGRPSTIFPFLLKLLRSFELGDISEENTREILDAIESFLFRRAILGIEPSGLHAVFKSLWQDLIDGSKADINLLITADLVKNAIASKPTIHWPNNEEFTQAVIDGQLYRRKIVYYAIREYEISLLGETPSDLNNIEHIAPQKPTKDWKTAIPENYDSVVHTWGNLLPLTPVMNPKAGQSDFGVKSSIYEGSMFASAREVAKETEWNTSTIRQRSEKISKWAELRWRY